MQFGDDTAQGILHSAGVSPKPGASRATIDMLHAGADWPAI